MMHPRASFTLASSSAGVIVRTGDHGVEGENDGGMSWAR